MQVTSKGRTIIMNALYDLPAPAKLNLFLHITGRRRDGYHLIQSVFELVDLCDTLHIEKTANHAITRSDDKASIGDVLPNDDLVVKAAKLLQQVTGMQAGAHIHLQKRIPMQAGMGGGSSDAATCLIALNRLWRTGLSRQVLMNLGASLGADVPFFLFGQHAWVEGIGEQLQAIKLPKHRYLVIKPPIGLSTAKIFTDSDLKRDFFPVTMRDYADSEDCDEKVNFQNCLEVVAKKQCPEIQIGLDWFKANRLDGKMTGSGSALFARVNKSYSTTELENWDMFDCESLAYHPLKHWLD
jgi:4-diphosphocytidyl-2-C-methyl-D-erythritol kinase